MEEIQCREGSEESGFQRQHQRKIKPRLMMDAVCGIHRHQRDDGREHQHQRAQPVHAEVILDAQGRRPCVLLDESVATENGPPAPLGPHNERQRQVRDGREEGHGARMLAREERNHRPREG